jgi:hypothetical protein
MKKRTYVLSKSTSEKADAILGQIRRENAVKDLLKSNKRMGIISTNNNQPTTTQATQTTTAKSKKK